MQGCTVGARVTGNEVARLAGLPVAVRLRPSQTRRAALREAAESDNSSLEYMVIHA